MFLVLVLGLGVRGFMRLFSCRCSNLGLKGCGKCLVRSLGFGVQGVMVQGLRV